MSSRFALIGERLRDHRLAAHLTTEAAADAAGISRALLYRYESGEIVKLDVLERLAQLYATSTSSLMGLGNEYVTHGMVFFDRVQRLEENATRLTVVFGPQAYVLSSQAYDDALAARIVDQRGNQLTLSDAESQRLMYVLRKRKAMFERNRISMVNIIPLGDIERYLAHGLGGHAKLPSAQRAQRRRAARAEVERLAQMVASPPIGVQIGLTTEPLPTAGFEIIHTGPNALLVLSPFRVVEPVNIHYGVATFTRDNHALRLHQDLADRLWSSALKGSAASQELNRLLNDPTF